MNNETCSICGEKRHAKGLCKKHYIENYQKTYLQRPEVIEKRKEYYQRQDVKARKKAYEQTSEYKAQVTTYLQRPEVVNRKKEYMSAYNKAYRAAHYQPKEVKHVCNAPNCLTCAINKNVKNREYQHTKTLRQTPKTITQSPEEKARKRKEYEREIHRQYYHANPSKYIAKSIRTIKRRLATDEAFRTQNQLRKYFAKVLKDYAKGKVYRSSKYGVDFVAIVKHLGAKPNENEKYVIDHIRPLCSFDLTNPDQVKLAFAPENHRWLTQRENLAKIAEDVKLSIHKKKRT